jgi:predicted branched-subunit amino acid permease
MASMARSRPSGDTTQRTLAAGMFNGRTQMPVLLVAIAASVIADRWLPPGWAVMSAGLAGGLTAWLRFKPEEGA